MKLSSLTILVSCLLNFVHLKSEGLGEEEELDHADQPKIITSIPSTINLIKPIAMVLQAEDDWHLAEKICNDLSFMNSRMKVLITLFLTTL